ncbi:MAG: effector-associated domain EAD1-containing protein [Caldilineaceae bacterium]
MDQSILKRLRKVLVELYPDEASMRRVVSDAGIDVSLISFDSKAVNNWHSILREAQLVHKVNVLLSVVEEEYPTNEALRQVCAAYRQAVDSIDHTKAELPASASKKIVKRAQTVSDKTRSRQATKQTGDTKQNAETASNRAIHQQDLQTENTLRSQPNFTTILQKSDFVPKEERDGRKLTIVRPKVSVSCTLPIAISAGSCIIEFSDSFLRGLTISLGHKDILQQLIIGRHTAYQWNARKFINMANDGRIWFSIDPFEVLLTPSDALDLCECIDKVADAYVASMLDAENTLEAWNRRVESYYPEGNHYGYEILFSSVETWKKMFQFARENSQSSKLGYEFYTSNSSITIETGPTAHAEIVPQVNIPLDRLPNGYISLLYIPPEFDESWQNDIGSKGIWTANFTKNWILTKFLPVLQDCSAKDRLESECNPNIFRNINDPQLFAYHLDVIHTWVCNGNKPTSLFIDYCQAFNQLVNNATIEGESMWGYVLRHTAMLRKDAQAINGKGILSPGEEFQSILANNLEYLRQLECINYYRGLDYMFRGHFVFLRDFKVHSTQSVINNFKKVLWPLFERASFENRFCH